MALHKEAGADLPAVGQPGGAAGEPRQSGADPESARATWTGRWRCIKEQERICRQLGDPGGAAGEPRQSGADLESEGRPGRGDGAAEGTGADLPAVGQPGGAAGEPRQSGADLEGEGRPGRGDGAAQGEGADLPAAGQPGGAAGEPRQSGADLETRRATWTGRWRCTRNRSGSAGSWANLAGLQRSLGNQALILKARATWTGRWRCYKEQERICRQLGDPGGAAGEPRQSGGDLAGEGRPGRGDGAAQGDRSGSAGSWATLAGLQASLGNQALILQAKGDLDGAMALHKEKGADLPAAGECRWLGNISCEPSRHAG